MAIEVCAFLVTLRRFKPHILMVLVQTAYSSLHFMTEASFNHGMNPHVFVTYRHILACSVVFPVAYFLERNKRPKLTLGLLVEIFLLSLFGNTLSLNMYFVSLKYTSPTFVVAMTNTIAALTFTIAVILRLEILDVGNARGLAKIIGTLVSLAGVMTMTLYKGPAARSLWSAPMHISKNNVHENWVKGPILAVGSCISWSIWYIMQAFTLKKYPAQLSLTAWVNFFAGAQSAVFTASIQHKPAAWFYSSNIELMSTIYAGLVCSGLTIFAQLWCTARKGPVFVSMFSPVATVMVAVAAYFFVGEKLYTGNLLGGVLALTGLYLLLWGKANDQAVHIKSPEQSYSTHGQQKEFEIRQAGSAEEREVL